MDSKRVKEATVYIDNNVYAIPNAMLLRSDNLRNPKTKEAWNKAQQCADMFNRLDIKLNGDI